MILTIDNNFQFPQFLSSFFCAAAFIQPLVRMQRQGATPDFSKSWHMSDVVLVVKDQRFHVHRSVLSMCSPVFETMFTSNFKEKDQSEIHLTEKKANQVKELLLVIYPMSTAKSINQENVNYLLELADQYQMEQLTERCETHLVAFLQTCKFGRIGKAISFFVLAEKYRLQKLRKDCIEFLHRLQDWNDGDFGVLFPSKHEIKLNLS